MVGLGFEVSGFCGLVGTLGEGVFGFRVAGVFDRQYSDREASSGN